MILFYPHHNLYFTNEACFQQITVVIHTFSTLNAFLNTSNQFESNPIDMSGFGQF